MTDSEYQIICYEEVGSTNDAALLLSRNLKGKKVAVRAKRQTAGRGRRGRNWQSLDGNLFFSMLRGFDLQKLGILVMSAALAVADTIKTYDMTADVRIKWPNDVLLNGAKVCGMLLEKGAGKYMVIGIGVNILQSPKSADMLYPTVSLREAGIVATADDFLQRYLPLFEKNLRQSAKRLRRKWLQYAKGIGSQIVVRQNGTEQTGIFEGIDENADLILRIGDKTQKILAGDVFFVED
ncbi:MAG: biotin--[Alphaproteobacteria bacterium]|nr:biotin--[acetyl-CoA-carboxylase] ligase [Alphaproteobacteria bacterium]